jgi:hypothetical protein
MTAGTAKTRLLGAVHEDRVMSMIDGLDIQAKHVLANARMQSPHAFDERRDRRVNDRESGTDTIDCTGVILGNDDIVCERGEAQPDGAFTLPIYPKPSDFA